MSRFVTPAESPDSARSSGRSVYEDRPKPPRPWIQVAETNPLTGALEWDPDWARRVLGWMPLDEFRRRR